MTPLVLTYVICAVAEPARCETHHLVSLAPDELRCIQTAQAEIRALIEEWPDKDEVARFAADMAELANRMEGKR